MAVNLILRHKQVWLLLAFCGSLFCSRSETSRSYYDSLHVEPTATAREIKEAFRKLAIKYHPDKNKSVGAEKKFLEIAEAHRVLSDQKMKWLYDTLGHKGVRSSAEPDESCSFDTFSDIFREAEKHIHDPLEFYWSDPHHADESYDEESSFHF